MAYEGLELKLKRVAARVKAQDVAREMGVGQSRVSDLERRYELGANARERYLAALNRLIERDRADGAE